MAFLAPIIVGAIGLSGVAATIGTALVGAALSLGIGYAAQRLLGKEASVGAGLSGIQLSLNMDPNAARKIPVGKTATAGDLKYWQLSGSDNQILEKVIILGDWPCEALTGLFVNGERVTLNADGTVVEFPDVMKMTFHNGDFDQIADAELVANSDGRMSHNDRGSGVCYVKVWMKYHKELYSGGQPRLLFEIEAAKFYDWRKDDTAGGVGAHRWSDIATWEYTDNPAVIAYNWRRGLWHGSNHFTGMQTPAGAFNLDSYTTAANICDEDVPLKSGGSEKRYRISGILDDSLSRRDVLQEILKVMGGEEIESGGFYTLYAGASRPVVMALDEYDLMADADFTYTGTKSGNELVNAVFGAHRDPESGYQEASLPPRIGTAEVALDGQRHDVRFNYEMVTSPTQCQRLMEQTRREARFQGVLETTFRARCSLLQPGDWVTLSVESRGWVNRLFQVIDGTTLPSQQAPLVLAETSSTVFEWFSSMELDQDAPGQIGSGAPTLSQLSGLSIENMEALQEGGSARRPGLLATWTPITDLTIDAIRFEYRIKDSAGVPLERRAEHPPGGQYGWLDGIQGRVRYEVRALLVSTPARPMIWTPWVTPLADTAPQVVDLGATVIEIAPGSVGHAELDAQSRFEMGLAMQVEGILGPAFEIESEHGIFAMLEDYRGWEDHEIATREVRSQVGSVSSSVIEVMESVAGIHSRWAMVLNQNGQAIGMIQLDGTNGTSSIDIVADHFRIALIEGGESVPVFAIDNTVDPPKMVFAGDFFLDGQIRASALDVSTLSALTANLGTVRAGRVESADGKSWWDLNTGEFVMGAVS